MLAYLDLLCAALLGRDPAGIHHLLTHPLAATLPRVVREEALALAALGPESLRAPVQTLRYYHQTAQLLASTPESAETTAARGQLELPLTPPRPSAGRQARTLGGRVVRRSA